MLNCYNTDLKTPSDHDSRFVHLLCLENAASVVSSLLAGSGTLHNSSKSVYEGELPCQSPTDQVARTTNTLPELSMKSGTAASTTPDLLTRFTSKFASGLVFLTLLLSFLILHSIGVNTRVSISYQICGIAMVFCHVRCLWKPFLPMC
jgi:hypothetical protein